MHIIRGPDGKYYDLAKGFAQEVSLSEPPSGVSGTLMLPYADENNAMISTMEDTARCPVLPEADENNASISTMEDTSHRIELRP